MKRKTSLQRGFTLVELIVTITILTVLAGVLIPSVNNYLEKSNRGKASSEMKEIANVFSKYKADTFDWPTPNGKPKIKTGKHNFTSYPSLYRNTMSKKDWAGPYLNKGVMVKGYMNVAAKVKGVYDGLIDPWGRPYRIYTFSDGYSGTSGGIMLVSYGYDGKLSSSTSEIFASTAQDDDLVQLITYSLK